MSLRVVGVVVLLSLFARPVAVHAQTKVAEPLAVEPAPEPDDRNRPWVAIATLGGVYAPLTVWSYFAWYHDKDDLPEFKYGGDGLFGERTYAGGADKLGHLWINLALSRATTGILRMGGWDRMPASLLASGMSFAFFAFIEVKDGFYYEFSPADFVMNGVGAGLSAVLVNVPRVDELIDFRLQYFPSKLFRDQLADDGNVDIAEDYSGQTYMVALHLGALPGVRGTAADPWLRFVDLEVGYGTRGYKPDDPAASEEDRWQELQVGFALNLQGVFDVAFGERRASGWRTVGAVGHHVFELWQPPFTVLPVFEGTRSPDHP